MQALGETRYGVDFRELIDSALSRPKHSAIYENADIIRQMPNLEREDLQAVLQYAFASS